MGRSRSSKALRRQRKIAESLDVSWKKYARCVLCNHRFCVNNYADRKVRVNQTKIGGKIVCPWCKHRFGKFGIQLMLIAQRVAEGTFTSCDEVKPENCNCLECVAGRILAAHAEAPTRR